MVAERRRSIQRTRCLVCSTYLSRDRALEAQPRPHIVRLHLSQRPVVLHLRWRRRRRQYARLGGRSVTPRIPPAAPPLFPAAFARPGSGGAQRCPASRRRRHQTALKCPRARRTGCRGRHRHRRGLSSQPGGRVDFDDHVKRFTDRKFRRSTVPVLVLIEVPTSTHENQNGNSTNGSKGTVRNSSNCSRSTSLARAALTS
jgi:hypothetical protein